MIAKTVETILDRTLTGYELSSEEGEVLLNQTDSSAIIAIRATAGKLYKDRGIRKLSPETTSTD